MVYISILQNMGQVDLGVLVFFKLIEHGRISVVPRSEQTRVPTLSTLQQVHGNYTAGNVSVKYNIPC